MSRLMLTLLLVALGSPLVAADRLEHVDVFVSGEGGYHTYRIPTIEAAPDGSLLAFCEARKHHTGDPGTPKQDIDLVYRRSVDGGKTWSPIKLIEDPGEMWSAGNPDTVVDRQSGRVWLFYVRCKPGKSSSTAQPGTDDTQLLARTSDDSGQTWSEPTDLTGVAKDMADPKWRISVPGPGGAIQDRSGRLLVGMWKHEPYGTFVLSSEDHGRTWQRSGLMPGTGDENQLVELSDGSILMDRRQSRGPAREMLASADGGRTWSEPRPGNPVTTVCCAIERWTLKSAGDDRDRILWTGPKGPGRTSLVARISYDEGKTFPVERSIWDKHAAYSDLAVLKDKTIGLLWERGESRLYQFITFTRLDREFLEPKTSLRSPPGGAKEVNTPAARGERKQDQLKVGAPAPDFTLSDPLGKSKTTLSSFRGKQPVVLIFGSFT